MSPLRNVFPPARHDHGPCMRAALDAAAALARERGLRFTPLRRRVYEIVMASHCPMGAYDILNEFAAAHVRAGGARRKPAPPTVYRALDFLMAQGFVHRIDTLNAYVACFAPERGHRTQFLLCKACGCVAEIENAALAVALARAAADTGFVAERETVEISGLCADCAGNSRRSSTHAPSP